MALIGSFNSRPAAEMAASMLQSRDVPAAVVGDDAGGTAGVNLAAGGYRLEVPDGQRAEAEALLDHELDTEDALVDRPEDRRPWLFQVVVAALVVVVVVAAVVASVGF